MKTASRRFSPGLYRNLRLFVLDPYDLLLSKLTRNSPIDQDDVEYLTNTMRLDPQILVTGTTRN